MWQQQKLKNIDESSVPPVYDVRKEAAETCYRFCFLHYSTLTNRSTTNQFSTQLFLSQISGIRSVQYLTKHE